MTPTKLALAATAILIVAGSAAFAEDELKGQVTQVNRLSNTVAIRPIQEGTVGANTAGSEQQFKVKDGVSLEDLHAGNRITYSVMTMAARRRHQVQGAVGSAFGILQ